MQPTLERAFCVESERARGACGLQAGAVNLLVNLFLMFMVAPKNRSSPPPHDRPVSLRGFVLRFALAFVVLEALVYLVLWYAPFFAPYAEWNARMTAALLHPFLDGTRAEGGYLMAPTFSLQVRPGCDSYQAIAVLLAGIVAFPATLGRKLLGAGLGIAALLALNLLRLAALLWTGVYHGNLFQRMHLEILPALFVGAALCLLLAWASWARSAASPPRTTAGRT